jgi:hypothetical protein
MTTVTLIIENECQIAHPQIEIIPYDPEMYLTFGRATEFEYGVVNITNKDNLLCNISALVITVKILEWNAPGTHNLLIYKPLFKLSLKPISNLLIVLFIFFSLLCDMNSSSRRDEYLVHRLQCFNNTN